MYYEPQNIFPRYYEGHYEPPKFSRVLRRQSLFSLVVYTSYMYYEGLFIFPDFYIVFIYLFNLLLIIIIIYYIYLNKFICFIWGYGTLRLYNDIHIWGNDYEAY
jgi:hypothetical protein